MKSPYVQALLLILLFACNKKDSNNTTSSTEKPGQIKGMGNSKEAPTGTVFTWPTGISLESETVRGYDLAISSCNWHGTGDNVTIELKLKSTLTKDTTITLPAGLIFTSTGEAFQNGMLIQNVSIPVARAGGSQCSVKLLLYCLNHSKNPSTPDALYKLGPVSNSSIMKEFMELVKNKDISYKGQMDYQYMCDLLQDAIWNITDGNGLTQQDRTNIAELPNK